MPVAGTRRGSTDARLLLGTAFSPLNAFAALKHPPKKLRRSNTKELLSGHLPHLPQFSSSMSRSKSLSSELCKQLSQMTRRTAEHQNAAIYVLAHSKSLTKTWMQSSSHERKREMVQSRYQRKASLAGSYQTEQPAMAAAIMFKGAQDKMRDTIRKFATRVSRRRSSVVPRV